jgi:glucokinase
MDDNVETDKVDANTVTNNHEIIGVDLGGTKLHVGRTKQGVILSEHRHFYNARASEDSVVKELINSIESQITHQVAAIGIGVPSIVDIKQGIVYDVVNIPSWKEIHLQSLLQEHFKIPVRVNNDVNCFTLGEHRYGLAKDCSSVVGLCLGTGMGVGLVINGQLYNGNTCAAGELGSLAYRDGVLENYCSGQFFRLFHHSNGDEIFIAAEQGDAKAQAIFQEFGKHLAYAVSAVLLAYDPEIIVLGGSVSKAHKYFLKEFNAAMTGFSFKKVWQQTKFVVSNNTNSAILGAACLISDKG